MSEKHIIDEVLKKVHASDLSSPFSVSFTVTRKCNYMCRHCYNMSGSDVKEELTDEELLDIARQLAELHPTDICICGGEPLIRGEVIFDIIKICKNNCGSINIVSNGFLINEETAKKLKNAGIDTLQISLDGNTPFLHNFMRMNSQAYDRAISAMKNGVKSGLSVCASCCPNKLNIPYIEDICKLLVGIGVNELRLMPLLTMGRGLEMDIFKPSSDEYLLLQQKIYLLNKKYKNLYLEWGDPLDHLSRMPENGRKNLNTFNLEVRSDGKLILSSYLPIVVGDLKQHTIKEYWDSGYNKIWSNEKILPYINNIYSTSQLASFEPMAYTGKDIEIFIPIGD